MKNLYCLLNKFGAGRLIILSWMLILALPFQVLSQVREPFVQRTNPAVFTVQGDFTMIGNANLRLPTTYVNSCTDRSQNGYQSMTYIDIDGDGSTVNSSSSELVLPAGSTIVYAGLYWTGRGQNSGRGSALINGLDKSVIKLKHASAGSYTTINAIDNNFTENIYYPPEGTSGGYTDGYMYSAYADVTAYVKEKGAGNYFAADIACAEGNIDGSGFYGGWGMIVVYSSPSITTWRDVTIFTGHAYVEGDNVSHVINVSGFETANTEALGMKLGMIAGEGDCPLTGDYFQILDNNIPNNWKSLDHGTGTSTNFFNSSITTGAPRNPSYTNNGGFDLQVVSVSDEYTYPLQNQANFRYGSTGDSYIICAIAMSVNCAASLQVTKTATECDFNAVNDVIHYTIVVTNTGTVPLSNISVTDPKVGLSETIPSLAAGASVTYTPTYTVTPADIAAGEVENTVNASYSFGGVTRGAQATETVPAFVIHCPAAVNLPACSSEGDVQTAYNNWVSGFTYTGGSGVTTNRSAIPSLPVNAHCVGANLTFAYTASDACSSLECTSTFTVAADTELPVILDLADYTLEGCNTAWPASVTTTWTDNCSQGGTITGVAGDVVTEGCTQHRDYTFNVTDNCGNAAVTTTTRVTRQYDETKPVIADLADYTLEGCNAAWPASVTTTWTDNCSQGGTITGVAGDVVTEGCTQYRDYTFNVTDGCGNAAVATTTRVTRQNDGTAPAITTQAASQTVECDGAGNVAEYNAWLAAHAHAVATDDCGGELTWSYTEGTWSDDCGLTKSIRVTFFATDGCGNKSDGTTATFTIQDTTKPAFACPQNIHMLAELGKDYATVTIAVPTVNEACGTVTLVNDKTNTSDASGQYPIGTTEVTYTATDECGNTHTCSFTVTISDNQAPDLTCPSNITGIECKGDVPGIYATLAEFLAAGGTATDNQGIDPNSFGLLSETSDKKTCPETITRVYTISDTDGNTATCSQTITVHDVTLPLFTTVPVSKTVECDGYGNPNDLGLWLVSAAATDNCGTPVVTHNYGEGNMLSDGCGATGSVTVTWTATDACGNKRTTSATFTIVDTTAPNFVVPANMEIQADENCEFNADPAVIGSEPTELTDNCADADDLTVTYSDVLSKGVNPGEQIVTRTWTVTDPCGNATSKTQVITVLGGNAPPELVLHEICVYLSHYGKYTLNSTDLRQLTAGSTANCGATTDLTFTVSPMSFECKDVFAKVPVTVTARDSYGNTATGITHVLVMDTISPVALCKDTTVYLDKFGQAFVFPAMVTPGNDRESTPDWAKHFNDLEGGSYDNCGIAEMHLSRQLFTCADLGSPKQVTLTVLDPSGNDASCEAMITVLDTIKPVITPVANLTLTVEPGVCTSKIDYPAIVVKDNCDALLESIAGLGPNGMFPLGTTTETWKASNVGGTYSTMSFTVTLNTYNGAPTVATVADLTVNEDAGKFEVPLTGIGYGVDCVPQQVVSLEVANSNTALLTVEKEYVNGEATGKLWITPLANQFGEAIITLTVKDNGGTLNGGIDTTVKSFKVTVVSVNDSPVVTPIADQFVTLPNSLSVNLSTAFTDVDQDDLLTYTVTLANGSPLPAWMLFDPATGMLTGTPTAANLGVTEVKVVATDKAGATAQDVFLVVVLDPAKSIINGTVLKGTTPLTGGIRVVLMVKDGNMFNAVANTTISANGTFSFYNLANGTYILKAEVTDAVLNPGLLHTYYTSFPSVTQATQMNITAAGTQNATITMLPVTLAAGDYVIKGKVVRKTGSPDLIAQGKDPVSTPAVGIDMVLKKDGAIVANTVTGADGTYEFKKLPEGEYEVFVELPGYTQEVSQKATVNAANPVKDKVNFTIWTDNNVHIITKVSDLLAGFGMKLYPNPTTGRVNIDLDWKDVREVLVSVFTIQGDQVFRKAYFTGERIVLDLSGNASGMYMIRLDGENRSEISKLIIDKR